MRPIVPDSGVAGGIEALGVFAHQDVVDAGARVADRADVGVGIQSPAQDPAQHAGLRAVRAADFGQSRRALERGVVEGPDALQCPGAQIAAGAQVGPGAAVLPPEIQREGARGRGVEDGDGGIDELGADAIPGDKPDNITFHGVLDVG